MDSALPTLTGTPKQITWAEKIRNAKVADLSMLLATVPASDPAWETGIAVVDHILSQATAAWWIDRRDYPAKRLYSDSLTATGLRI